MASAPANPTDIADPAGPAPADAPALLVACLCARWCGTCRDYEPVLAALQREFGSRVRTRWIDIEDEAELVGDVDVDDFPTLLIARDAQPMFFGSVTPHAATVSRLVANALDGHVAALGSEADPRALDALLGRLGDEIASG